ncbi:hypothetical protein L228DRAFT_282485 [Xylona heveae TC161]|uniref:DUF7905 domain-containing protein n=1 Tax=Xylona heveae (strain CBS 132557 / TC161) TaxID=1328760 RepID=A0A165HPI1_XYLHT|nr:hypothetical protein L228DRAFT_282485 [Xylona heveae TC161]KZF23802.1 hypothetical protein L228DRAFT_282485 [Xylona heveae TC161]
MAAVAPEFAFLSIYQFSPIAAEELKRSFESTALGKRAICEYDRNKDLFYIRFLDASEPQAEEIFYSFIDVFNRYIQAELGNEESQESTKVRRLEATLPERYDVSDEDAEEQEDASGQHEESSVEASEAGGDAFVLSWKPQDLKLPLVQVFSDEVLSNIGTLTSCALSVEPGKSVIAISSSSEHGLQMAESRLDKLWHDSCTRPLAIHLINCEGEADHMSQFFPLKKLEKRLTKTTLVGHVPHLHKNLPNLLVLRMLKLDKSSQQYLVTKYKNQPVLPEGKRTTMPRVWGGFVFKPAGSSIPYRLHPPPLSRPQSPQKVPQTPIATEPGHGRGMTAEKAAQVQQWVQQGADALEDPFTADLPSPNIEESLEKAKKSESEEQSQTLLKTDLHANSAVPSQTSPLEQTVEDPRLDEIIPPTKPVASSHPNVPRKRYGKIRIPKGMRSTIPEPEQDPEPLPSLGDELAAEALPSDSSAVQDRADSTADVSLARRPASSRQASSNSSRRSTPFQEVRAFHPPSEPITNGPLVRTISSAAQEIPSSEPHLKPSATTSERASAQASISGSLVDLLEFRDASSREDTGSQTEQPLLLDLADDGRGSNGGIAKGLLAGSLLPSLNTAPLIPRVASRCESRASRSSKLSSEQNILGERLQETSEVESRTFRKTMEQQKAPEDEDFTNLEKNIAQAQTDGMKLLEYAQTYSGEIKLQVDIGRILVDGVQKKFRKMPFVDEEFEEIFAGVQGQNGPLPTASFVKMLTTSFIDAEFITDLKSAGGQRLFQDTPHEYRITYEFNCLMRDNTSIMIEVDEDLEFEVKKHPTTLGTIYTHFPKRSWDTRLALTGTDFVTDAEVSEGPIKSIVKNINIPPGRTCLDLVTQINGKALRIQSVMLRRQANYASRQFPHVMLNVTEVQDLCIQVNKDDKDMVRACAMPQEQMVNDDRLWYEVAVTSSRADEVFRENLNIPPGDMVKWSPSEFVDKDIFDSLIRVASDVVQRIDSVGLNQPGVLASGPNRSDESAGPPPTLHLPVAPPMASVATIGPNGEIRAGRDFW